MKLHRKVMLTLAALGLGSFALARTASAAVIEDLVNPAGANTTVPVGTIIHAQWLVSTDNPNGIDFVQARIQESVNGGTSAQAHPFSAAVIPTNPANTSSNQPDVASWSSGFYQSSSTVTLATPVAKYLADGTPNSTTGNEPLPVFTAVGSSGDEFGDGYSPSNGTQKLLIDISYQALVPGTVTFSPTTFGNGSNYEEFSDTNGDAGPLSQATQEGGFTVTVTAVPEPASIGLGGLSLLGLLARRRKASR